MKKILTGLFVFFYSLNSAQSIKVIVGGGSIGICAGCGSIKTVSSNLPSMLVVTLQPTSSAIYQSESTTKTVAVSGGIAPYTYRLIYNGSQVGTGASVTFTPSVATTGYFAITDAANNSVNTNTFTITFNAPIVISSQPQNQSVNTSTSVTNSITATAHFTPANYQWYKNNLTVGTNSSTYTYTTGSTAGSDAIKCLVGDANGNSFMSATATITVNTAGASVMSFTYSPTTTLNSSSANVYATDGSGRIIRHLWGNRIDSAGTFTAIWDGLDDNGNYVPNAANYPVIVAKNGIKKYANANISPNGGWLGTVFNNSDSISGGTKYHGTQLVGMEIMGHKIILFHAYLENNYRADGSTIEHPRTKVSIGGLVGGGNFRSCNDGKTAYALATEDNVNYFVYGIDSNYSFHTFSNGSGTNQGVSLLLSIPHVLNGVAAQKDGQYNYVFVSYGDTVEVHDRTGTLIRKNYISGAGLLSCDQTNGLWIGTQKYIVNSDGSLTTSINVSGVLNAAQLSVSPDNSTVSFIDGDLSSQQIKSFSNSTGVSSWTFGQQYGYTKSSIVANDKFSFTIPFFGQTQTLPFISYQSDGSFWVNDCGGNREMHFNSSRTYLDQIAFVPFAYNMMVNPNNPSQIYSGYLRCTVDITSNDPQHNWTLDRNYTQMIPSTVESVEQFRYVSTFSNGRTYATIRNTGDVGASANKVIELTDTVRYTPNSYDWQSSMDKDGNISTRPIYNMSYQSLTGFDSNNNLVWGTASNYIGFAVDLNNDSLPKTIESLSRLTNGDVVTFDIGIKNGYKVGVIPHNGIGFRFLTTLTTGMNYKGAYPKDGFTTNGNGIHDQKSLGQASSINDLIYWNSIGEFWNAGQTSMHQILDKYGLDLWSDGVVQGDGYPVGECTPWNSGNGVRSKIVPIGNNNYWMVYGDESRHGGAHVAKLKIDSSLLQYETHYLTKTSNTPPVLNYIDLLAGFTHNGLPNTNGWSIVSDAGLIANTGNYTYGFGMDVYVSGYNSNGAVLTKNFPSNGTPWEIDGSFAYLSQLANAQRNPSNYMFIILYDVNGKTIAVVDLNAATNGINEAPHNLRFNFNTVYQDPTQHALNSYHDFSIKVVDATHVTFTITINGVDYSGTSTVLESDALINNPSYIKIGYQNGDNSSGIPISIDFNKLQFKNN